MNEQEVTELLLRAILDQKDSGVCRMMIKLLRSSRSDTLIRDGINTQEQKGLTVKGLRTTLIAGRLH